MTTAQQPTATQQRRIDFENEYRRVLRTFTPNCPGDRYSGAQQDRARAIARKNLAEIRFGQRKNDEAAAAIVARGGVKPRTDWGAIVNQLRADGKL